MKFSVKELTRFEKILWITSLVVVTISSFATSEFNPLSLIASLIGVTSLILAARGHALGQALIIIFAILYGIISYEQRYYGEMITYLGMTAPIAAMSLYTWLKNPYEGTNEVEIAKLNKKKIVLLTASAIAVTILFYYVLKWLGTGSLFFSTISVTTSFVASFLTMLRSEHYALAYAANDVVLIVLWVIAGFRNISYISMVACFAMFLINDLYGFYSWRKRKKEQQKNFKKFSKI